MYLERHFTLTPLNVTLQVHVTLKSDSSIRRYSPKSISQQSMFRHETYSFESIEFQLHLKESHEDISQMQVFLQDKSSKTSDPISLKIKVFDSNKQSKNSSIVCNTQMNRYLTPDFIDRFAWWTEINRINGYEKLVVYDNSIDNKLESSEYLKNDENKDFIEIIKFNCIPNLIDLEQTNVNFFRTFDEIRKTYKKYDVLYADHFELLIANECFLLNVEKFQYIAFLNSDQAILPKFLDQNDVLDTTFDTEKIKTVQSQCYYEKNKQQTSNTHNIDVYLSKLNSAMNFNRTVSYQFGTSIYLKHKSIDPFFVSLGNVLSKISDETDVFDFYFESEEKSFKDFTPSSPDVLEYKVSIKNEMDYRYAKNLFELYNFTIKPFYERNSQIMNKIYEPFNRLFYSIHAKATANNAKPIVNTDLRLNLPKKVIPYQHGHVSNFPKEFVFKRETKSIREFSIDLNYFLCYYLPVLKKFNFNPIF